MSVVEARTWTVAVSVVVPMAVQRGVLHYYYARQNVWIEYGFIWRVDRSEWMARWQTRIGDRDSHGRG